VLLSKEVKNKVLFNGLEEMEKMQSKANLKEYVPLLLKYKNGEDIDDADKPKLDTMASIGLIKKGISIKRKKITAKTTSTGIGLLG
jgi:hypothetical protein